MENINQIIIVGPTASGKTGLAVDLAKKIDGQIISADSRAIYKELDIGTAKPSTSERQGIVHYGFDLIYPSERFSSIKFKEYAADKVNIIKSRGKMPIIVGGSGLYIDSYVFNFQPPAVDTSGYTKLNNMSIQELQELITLKKLKMPQNPKNKLHLINTLLRGGKAPQRNSNPPEGSLIIGLMPNRKYLRDNISLRAEQMIDNGVIEEARAAFEKYGYYAPGLKGGIYAQLVKHFKEGLDIATVMENFIISDMQLAKRQTTWFKRNQFIKWFSTVNEAKKYLGLLN